jgi:hypothetical protein
MEALYNWIIFGTIWIIGTVIGTAIDDKVGTLAGATGGFLGGLIWLVSIGMFVS